MCCDVWMGEMGEMCDVWVGGMCDVCVGGWNVVKIFAVGDKGGYS